MRGVAWGSLRWCSMVKTSAAAWPLRTAPSMVSGHPVAVHAPAKTRPGSKVLVAGPQAGGACSLTEGGARLTSDKAVHDVRLACRREQGLEFVPLLAAQLPARRGGRPGGVGDRGDEVLAPQRLLLVERNGLRTVEDPLHGGVGRRRERPVGARALNDKMNVH